MTSVMGEVHEVKTELSKEYKFFPITNGLIKFIVRAPKNVVVILTRAPYRYAPKIEVVIGANNNTQSTIKKIAKSAPEYSDPISPAVTVDTPSILTDSDGFWVKWASGRISAGRECEKTAFIQWTDPEPFHIVYVGARIDDATAVWKFEGGDEFRIDNKEIFYPIHSGSLNFEYRGGPLDKIKVCLTKAPTEEDPMYEILIYGNDEAKIVFNRCEAKAIAAYVEPVNHWISIEWRYSGRILLRDLTTGKIILEYWDKEHPPRFTHFGIRHTAGPTSAFWGIENLTPCLLKS